MLGLEKGFVNLLPHNERWHQLFAEEKQRLEKAVGEFVLAIEHVGSTAICGIAAKPVLDIAIAIKGKQEGEKCIAPLENLGYKYRGENGIAGRFYFVKGTPAQRTHHLHLLVRGSDEWRNHLFFRDYLRQTSGAAAEYDKLKKDLARQYQNDRDAYTNGKAEFVTRILKNSTENLR